MKHFYLILFICFFLLSLSGLAAADFSAGILDRNPALENAVSIDRKLYPDADDVLVDEYICISYETDGTSLIWDDTFIKVLSEKGRRDNSTLSFGFTIPYEMVELKLLEIIKKDGAVIPVDIEKQSRIMIDDSQMAVNIYNPDHKILRVNIPCLDIGDIVRYVLFTNIVKPGMPDAWNDCNILEYTSPIKHLVIDVTAPKKLPLRHTIIRDEIKGAVKFSSEEKEGIIQYKWEINDVPQMFSEPDMPPLHSVVQRLLLSTIDRWETVSKWYWNLCEPHLKTVTPEMEKEVKAIISGLTGREEKIQAIFRYVSQKIRYMGITTEKDAPGYEPHDVKMTFENKYGVCRDKAALLVAMLRIACFKAYPVLIMLGPRKDPDVPNPYFNHAVSCVENEDGTYILMDATDENTKELFPSYLCNKSYLVAKPEGDTLRISPVIPAEQNLMHIRTESILNDSGILLSETKLDFSGINDGAYRNYFTRRKPEERKHFFEQLVREAVSGARLIGFDIIPKDISDTSQPLEISLKYLAENSLIEGGNKILIDLPWMGTSVGMVNFILGKTGLEKRKYPLVTDIACGVKESFSINLNDSVGKTVSIPQYAVIEKDTISWKRELKREGDILNGNSRFLIKAVEFPPPQYLELKQSLKSIEYNHRKKTIFYNSDCKPDKQFGSDADAVVMDQKVEYELLDENTWESAETVRKKILTYAGKKKNSELKFYYNPVWEKVRLEYAMVINQDGIVKKLSEHEINLMDAGWVGSAPRYPPEKILVASLPNVNADSIIEYKIVREFKNKPFFSTTQYLRHFDPVIRKNVTILNPDRLALKLLCAETMLNPKETLSSDSRYDWSVRNCNSLKYEQDMPPLWTFVPHVMLSSGNWKDYSQTLNNKFKKSAEGQRKTASIARKIAERSDNAQKTIKQIRDYVAKNIKPAGPAFNDFPLSVITEADKTVSDGYGNSADRAVVIYAMLETLGLKPKFVIASSLPMLDCILDSVIRCPQDGIFREVLVQVKIDEEFIYLNDTDQYAELGTSSHEGNAGLFLDSGKIEPIFLHPDKMDRSEISYRIELSDNGNALIKRTRRIFGTEFAYYHKKYAEMLPEERNRYYQELVATLSQSAKPAGKLVTDFDAYPGTEQFTVSIDNFAVHDAKYLYFSLPDTLDNLLRLYSEKREHPFYRDTSVRILKNFTVNFPDNYDKIQIAPPSDKWEIPEGGGSISVENTASASLSQKTGYLKIRQCINVNPVIIPIDKYENLLMINNRISHPEMQTVLLEEK